MTDLYVNIRTTAITGTAIIVAWYLDWSTVAFWYGGSLLIPAACIQVQNLFLKGSWYSRASWAVTPWVVYATIGIVRAAEISHVGQQNLVYGAWYSMLLSAAIGVAIIAARQFFRGSRGNT